MSTALDNNLAVTWFASTDALEVVSYDYSASITIYPNPAKNLFTVSTQSNIDKIELLDVTGKKIKVVQGNSNESHTDISDPSSGIYFVKVYTLYGFKT